MDLGAELRRRGYAIASDRRADRYDAFQPATVEILTIDAEKFSGALEIAGQMRPRPAVLIGADGNGIALSAGGSGVVAVHLRPGESEPDARRDETVEAARALLAEIAMPAPAPKKSKKTAVEPDPEPASDPAPAEEG